MMGKHFCNNLSFSFIKIVKFIRIKVKIKRGKRIYGLKRFDIFYHSAPNIRQLSPLPIPSKATRSPLFKKPLSAPNARVEGSEAAPVLPKYSSVEKSFFNSRDSVS